MVSDHNEQPFTYDNSDLLVSGKIRELETNGELTSSHCFQENCISDGDLRVEAVKVENVKRPPCDDDETNQVGCKRPKQNTDPNDRVDSSEADPNCTTTFDGSPPSSDDVVCSGCIDLPWMSLHSPVWVPTFPSYYDHPQITRFHPVEETCSRVHDYPPRKPVAIGPDHQAIIPDCNRDPPNHGDDYNDSDSEKWIKYCVIPMPPDSAVGTLNSRTDCSCFDIGSIRCIRQHVAEARENLRRNLGQERFEELGFCEMGEDVALKWTEEEESLFQKVVLSNPKSMDNNFWEELPRAFPDKTSRELISYYFNVFVLRKRAGQNRWDLMNIDSDDDEWVGRDPSGAHLSEEEDDGEDEEQEEEEGDSAIESLTDRDHFTPNKEYGDVSEESSEGEGVCFVSLKKTIDPLSNRLDDMDFYDDSCTSYEGQKECRFVDNVDNVFFDEHVGFTHGKERDDFLSTFNVIEEVIGMGGWENNDGSGVF